MNRKTITLLFVNFCLILFLEHALNFNNLLSFFLIYYVAVHNSDVRWNTVTTEQPFSMKL